MWGPAGHSKHYPCWQVLLGVAGGPVKVGISHCQGVGLLVRVPVATTEHWVTSLSNAVSHLSFLSSGSYLELVSKLTLDMSAWSLAGCQDIRAAFFVCWPVARQSGDRGASLTINSTTFGRSLFARQFSCPGFILRPAAQPSTPGLSLG